MIKMRFIATLAKTISRGSAAISNSNKICSSHCKHIRHTHTTYDRHSTSCISSLRKLHINKIRSKHTQHPNDFPESLPAVVKCSRAENYTLHSFYYILTCILSTCTISDFRVFARNKRFSCVVTQNDRELLCRKNFPSRRTTFWCWLMCVGVMHRCRCRVYLWPCLLFCAVAICTRNIRQYGYSESNRELSHWLHIHHTFGFIFDSIRHRMSSREIAVGI